MSAGDKSLFLILVLDIIEAWFADGMLGHADDHRHPILPKFFKADRTGEPGIFFFSLHQKLFPIILISSKYLKYFLNDEIKLYHKIE